MEQVDIYAQRYELETYQTSCHPKFDFVILEDPKREFHNNISKSI